MTDPKPFDPDVVAAIIVLVFVYLLMLLKTLDGGD